MTAPLPSSDDAEEPTTLVAITLAKTLAPQAKLKGEASKYYIGIVQLFAVMIDAFDPLQFVISLA